LAQRPSRALGHFKFLSLAKHLQTPKKASRSVISSTYFPGDPISNPGPDMVKGFLTVQHHFDPGSDPDNFNDPSDWNQASYTPDLLAELGEPLPDAPNGYRQAALYHLQRFRLTNHMVVGIGAGPGIDGWLFPGEPRRRR
jgi:hypothetical protein